MKTPRMRQINRFFSKSWLIDCKGREAQSSELGL